MIEAAVIPVGGFALLFAPSVTYEVRRTFRSIRMIFPRTTTVTPLIW